MSILVFTSASDPCVELVHRAVEERRGRIFCLDTTRFPTDAQIHLEPAGQVKGAVTVGRSLLPLAEISAVWIRQPDVGANLPADMDPVLREACRVQSDCALWSLLECLRVFQLDPPEVLQRAPYKPRQLQLAQACGLEVPRTLMTNDPQAVRAFAAGCPGGLITKLVDSARVVVETANGSAPVYTRVVGFDELDDLEGLDLCPMLFQERVPKALELRITVVGSRMFVAAVEPGPGAEGLEDWRGDRTLVEGFRPYEDLPELVRARLFGLLDCLGLNFATIDMILTADGRYVFLELNTVSYFDFVERSAGLPISGAIADLLLGRSAPRVEPRLR